RAGENSDVETQVLEVDVALHALHHVLGDHPLVAEAKHRLALRLEQLAPQPLILLRAYLDTLIVRAVVARGEAVRAEAVGAPSPLCGVLSHPALGLELLEARQGGLGGLDPGLRVLTFGTAVVFQPEPADEDRQRQALPHE